MSKDADRILFLSSVYVPDPASVGQHYADVAEEAARRGYRPVVLTSRGGYEDPSVKYRWTEMRAGVRVVRLPFSSFGKGSMGARILGGTLFTLQAAVLGLLLPGLRRVVVTTAPPQLPFAALVLRVLRRIPFTYWVMDLNPDQSIELGVVDPEGIGARVLGWLQGKALRGADRVVTLDRFMSRRIEAYGRQGDVRIIPPWPHDDHLENVGHEDNPFRRELGLTDELVVMYSGNHGVHNPLDAVVGAAKELADEPGIRFVFVGGGVGKKSIDDWVQRERPSNVTSLPYQPLDRLRFSLSAADLHVVSMDGAVVGMSHPCKVYGAMAVGRPIVFLGPATSHVGDIIEEGRVGWRFEHGDTDGLVALLRRLLAERALGLEAMGRRAESMCHDRFGRDRLLPEFTEVALADG